MATVAGAVALLTFAGAGGSWLATRRPERVLPGPSATTPVSPVTKKAPAARPAARPAVAVAVSPEDEAADDDAPERSSFLNARPEADDSYRGPSWARSGAAQGRHPALKTRAVQRVAAQTAPNAAAAPTMVGPPNPKQPLSPAPGIAPPLDQDKRAVPIPVSDSSL